MVKHLAGGIYETSRQASRMPDPAIKLSLIVKEQDKQR